VIDVGARGWSIGGIRSSYGYDVEVRPIFEKLADDGTADTSSRLFSIMLGSK
jgi:hypothetical protein